MAESGDSPAVAARKVSAPINVSADTAIRYVIEKRALSHDPQIKSNADATLAVLQQSRQ